jgi:hypothetical protein
LPVGRGRRLTPALPHTGEAVSIAGDRVGMRTRWVEFCVAMLVAAALGFTLGCIGSALVNLLRRD